MPPTEGPEIQQKTLASMRLIARCRTKSMQIQILRSGSHDREKQLLSCFSTHRAGLFRHLATPLFSPQCRRAPFPAAPARRSRQSAS
jgi:hypothetical protein